MIRAHASVTSNRKLTFTKTEIEPAIGIARLTSYQFAGDCETHGIPAKT